jgi:hypothetical protein
MMPMITFDFDEAAAGWAVAAAGAVVGLTAAGAVVGATVGAAPVVGGEVGATAVGVLHAASKAEAIGKPRPTTLARRRSARRVVRTSISYSPQ